MSSTPNELGRINGKLNAIICFFVIFFVTPMLVSIFIPRFLPGRFNAANPIAAWEPGKPFGADFDGSQEQRRIVERAKNFNGTNAVKIDLHVLDLSRLTLSADDLQTINTLKDLRELNLQKTNIQDSDLAQLTALWKLESLNLSDTQISDTSLPILQKFRNLRVLELADSKVTSAGVRELHANMKELRARLYGVDSGHSGNCIHATLGKIVLVKYGQERVAFKFTELTKTGDGGAKYIWYWQPVANAKFQAETIKQGEAEVFEKYRSFNKGNGSTMMENDGGQLEMVMGPAKLEWSKPRTVYYPWKQNAAKDVLFAFTKWEQLEDVNFDDESLKWYEQTGR
jgi:hypothetical protein